MTSVKYDDIFSPFLSKVRDFDFLRLDEPEVYDLLAEKLRMAVSVPVIRKNFSKVTLDDKERNMSFELKFQVDADEDKDYVIMLVSEQMVVEWLRPVVYNRVNLAQMYGTKEGKFFSQAQHLSELKSLLKDAEHRVRDMMSERHISSNSYLSSKKNAKI